MANEVTHNTITGLTLYFCRFQQDGDVFLSNPATDEVWGTGGRTADDYDVAMTEEDACGHYKGTFATAGTIASGVYQIVVYQQAGASPATGDRAIAQGEIYWDGTAESTLQTIINKLPDDYIMGSSVTTSMDDEIDSIEAKIDIIDTNVDTIVANTGKVIYGSVTSPTGVKKTIAAGSVTGFVEDDKL